MTTIQKLSFTQSRIQKVSDLYFLKQFGTIDIVNGKINMRPQSKISFNTYFNCFYEEYWKKYTSIKKVIFRFKIKGDCIVSLYRDSKFNGCYILKELHIKNDDIKIIEDNISFEDDVIPDSGRIFIDIFSNDDVEIEEIAILCDSKNDKKLSIGICTFNREDFLLKNLQNLLELSKSLTNINKIIVVNQGNEFSNQNLLNLLEQNKSLFDVHKQGNLGGTGGFTRTLYEVSTKNLSDFHLLMDDDIILDCNVINTAFQFASFANKQGSTELKVKSKML